ncbi:hypothetical protein GCM10007913_35130 [Devosia yakushimensis]|uniref:Secreted protein n=1 Tax=Devosia yakushimensis TaxID=470028 RepID=A0ABQ5UHX1_9HYPH|nr:hypothetical protein [Devosia yakushimensis]GLQ11581.1 hypothetical protein GCM10007913_35130 [Devosia yakushimensis]
MRRSIKAVAYALLPLLAGTSLSFGLDVEVFPAKPVVADPPAIQLADDDDDDDDRRPRWWHQQWWSLDDDRWERDDDDRWDDSDDDD